MNFRRLAVCLGIGLAVSFAPVAVYVLTTRQHHRKKDEDDADKGTMNFPFLRDIHCIKFIMNSKVMFIMRGLPESGKPTVVRQIKHVYGDLAVICSADDFRVNMQGEYAWKAEEYEMTHLMCEGKAGKACENGKPVVIIDNTNTKESSLYKYVDIARSTGYHVVLVEPKTSWKYNIFELALKNHHKVSEEVLRELLSEFHQTIAVYYGWFLSESSARTLKDRMFEVLNDCCVRIPSFKDDLITTMASQQTQYESQGSPTTMQISSETSLSALSCLECPNNSLHVTAAFLGKRASSRAYDYVSSFAFQDALGSVNTLTVIAWTITPRTVSARVKLNLQQSSLWDNVDSCHEEEGSSDFNTCTLRHLESFDCSSESSGSPFIPPSYNDLVIKPTVGKGDTAHITMSRRSDVGSVQGRYDLRDLVRLELANQSYDEYKITSGLARCYGDGQWAVYLNEPIDVNALFTGFY